MHGAAAVSERVLGEPLRIAACLGPLRPRITITVQADAGHSGNSAPSAKLRGTRVGSRRLDRGKEIAGFRQGFEKLPEFRADAHPGRFALEPELLFDDKPATHLPS